jgi:hypothetical protein
VKAKRDGLVRYIGFSAHGVDAAKFLMDSMPLDSVLFPVNYINYAEGDFGPQILAGRKSVGWPAWPRKLWHKLLGSPAKRKRIPNCWYRPIEDPAVAEKALRFSYLKM